MTFRERLMLGCAGLLVAACAVVLLRCSVYEAAVCHWHADGALVHMVFADNPGLQHPPEHRTIPSDEVPVDWAARYPFAEEPAPPPAPQVAGLQARLTSWQDAARRRTAAFADWAAGRFPLHMAAVYGRNAYEGATGWNVAHIEDPASVTQLADGSLATFMARRDPVSEAAAVHELAAACEAQGIPFTLVLVPWKFDRSAPEAGTLDFSNENSDAFLAHLQAAGVDTLDLRVMLAQEGIAQRSLFFRTDHHWTPQAALWGARCLLAHLAVQTGQPAEDDALDPAAYDEERLPAFYLGSHGGTWTTARAVPEDFPILSPQFPTALHLVIPSMDIDRRGDAGVLLDRQKLAAGSAYEAYAYGNRALITVENEAAPQGLHLLLLRDSFGGAAAPFLALGTGRLDIIDPRYFPGSIRTYIAREHPDAVALLCSAIEPGLDARHLTPRSFFDFR